MFHEDHRDLDHWLLAVGGACAFLHSVYQGKQSILLAPAKERPAKLALSSSAKQGRLLQERRCQLNAGDHSLVLKWFDTELLSSLAYFARLPGALPLVQKHTLYSVVCWMTGMYYSSTPQS